MGSHIIDSSDAAQINALRAHLQDNLNLYGGQSLVNLVNHKGHEKPVKEAFEKYMAEVSCHFVADGARLYFASSQANMPKTKYEYFDFHNECKNMRWDRISVLLAKLEDDLNRQG